MSARSIGVYTIAFPDPSKNTLVDKDFVTLRSNISFQYQILDGIQTLSPKNSDRGSDPYGLLYVPDLRSDGCKREEERHVKSNVTRKANLPQSTTTEYAFIAVAPWLSPNCTIEYFESARTSPVKAFFVFQPGDSAQQPPPMSDPSWNLHDGGAWKAANNFPTYALLPIGGTWIMNALSAYSGNVTDAPNNTTLVRLFSPDDYIRIWATVNIEGGNQLPSLWVFLVIVLGILIVVILATSSFMHIIQRRRRNDLRRRVINGEVNLETLGVKRLTVPQDFLEKLPLSTYTSKNNEDPEKDQTHGDPPLARRSSAPTVPSSHNDPQPAFLQPTCPICIDDFEPSESQVRELPCRHIFHPECIDTFLLNNSSLCPMCKKSVLPKGYCPTKITNAMVRRERMLTRMRRNSAMRAQAGAVGNGQTQIPAGASNTSGLFGSLGSRIGGAVTGRRVFSAPARTQTNDIEMGTAGPPPLSSVPETTPAVQSQSQSQLSPSPERIGRPPNVNRREWAQQRALALIGHHHGSTNGVEEEENVPNWKRRLRKVFPGFR